MNMMPAARHFLSRLCSRRAAAEVEPADHGTAFGLELTYDDAPEPVSAASGKVSPLGTGWWRKLRSRATAGS